jgi:hypothetical protein
MTGDETCVSFIMIKPKRKQRGGCKHIHQTRQKKFKQMSTRKLTASVSWEKKGMLMAEFMKKGTKIM